MPNVSRCFLCYVPGTLNSKNSLRRFEKNAASKATFRSIEDIRFITHSAFSSCDRCCRQINSFGRIKQWQSNFSASYVNLSRYWIILIYQTIGYRVPIISSAFGKCQWCLFRICKNNFLFRLTLLFTFYLIEVIISYERFTCIYVFLLSRSVYFVTLLTPISHATSGWYCRGNRVLPTHHYRYRRKLSCLRDCKEKSRYEVCSNWNNRIIFFFHAFEVYVRETANGERV